MILVKNGNSSGPQFLIEPQPVVHLINNSRGVFLACAGQGNPEPTIQWLDQNHQEITRIPGFR